MSDEALQAYLQVLIDYFSLPWLETKGKHPLQLLWKRVDELATNELYALAHSIETMAKIDLKWTKGQVKIAKTDVANNYRGALFELFALSMLHAPEHPIKPAKMNQAGFDGILQGAGKQEVRVSIKNYGASKYQQQFEQKAKEIEGVILQLLRSKYYVLPCHILLDFPDLYPEEREWQMLLDNLERMLDEQRFKQEPFGAMVEPIDPSKPTQPGNSRAVFTFIVYPFKTDLESFHPKHISYTFIATAAYHRNEYKNLYSKLEEACGNLTKHSATESSAVINSLFIRLPDTVSLDKSTEWLEQYFALFPHKPITAVFLYQPAVVKDLTTNTSVIGNGFKAYVKPGAAMEGHYSLTVPVGRVTTSSVDRILTGTVVNGEVPHFPLYDRYVYQHGAHYLRMKPDGKGGFQGNITNLAGGVHTSVVLEFPNDPNSVIMSGKFPPSDELMIL